MMMNLLWSHCTLLLSRVCPSPSSVSCGSTTQVPAGPSLSLTPCLLQPLPTLFSNPRGSWAPLLYFFPLSSCSLQASGSLDGQVFPSPHPHLRQGHWALWPEPTISLLLSVISSPLFPCSSTCQILDSVFLFSTASLKSVFQVPPLNCLFFPLLSKDVLSSPTS